MQFHSSPRARWSLLIVGSASVVAITIAATVLLMNSAPTQQTKTASQVVSAPSDRDHWRPAEVAPPSPTPLATPSPMTHLAPPPQMAQTRYVQPRIPSPE